MTAELRQAWDVPSRPRPITSSAPARSSAPPTCRPIGGSACRSPGCSICGSTPRTRSRGDFGVPIVYRTLSEACRAGDGGGVVFDVAVPGDQMLGVLQCLPRGAAVLIQKPMGEDLAAARDDPRHLPRRGAGRRDEFPAAVQPERAGAARSARRAAARRDRRHRSAAGRCGSRGSCGRFMRGAPRLEVLYHSIHYLDTIRLLAGEPRRRLLPGGRASRDCRSFATRAARSSSTTAIACAAR